MGKKASSSPSGYQLWFCHLLAADLGGSHLHLSDSVSHIYNGNDNSTYLIELICIYNLSVFLVYNKYLGMLSLYSNLCILSVISERAHKGECPSSHFIHKESGAQED